MKSSVYLSFISLHSYFILALTSS